MTTLRQVELELSSTLTVLYVCQCNMAQVQLEKEYQEARRQEDEDWDDIDDEEEDANLQEDGFEDLNLPDGDSHIAEHSCDMSIPTEWTPGLTSFCCEKSVVNAINWFQSTNHCALGYKRTVKPNPEKYVKGRLNFACIHGLKNHRKNRHHKPQIRKKQRINYVGCEMKININQQRDGNWTLRGFQVDHINAAGEPAHLTDLDVFKSIRKAKEMVDGEALELLKEFRSVNAPTNSVAARLSYKYGVNYTRKDITNRINNKVDLLMSDSDSANVNTFLEDIVQGGGDVYAKYHADTNKCRVLIIMTKYQKIDLNLSRPRVYLNDRTFGKNSENFKVY